MSPHSDVVIVTGSSGLIGSAVVNHLAEQFRIVGFDKEGPLHPPPVAECVCVDVTSDQSVRDGLQRVRIGYGERIASVMHLAAYYDFSGEPSSLYDEVTVRGTERLLCALQRFAVEQFVFSSTMLVHAPCQPGQHINEDSPLEPKWAYPKSKIKTEKLIREQHGPIPIAILRIAGVYDDRCHSIPLAHQIQRIYDRRLTSHIFPGGPSHGQAFVHLDDLLDAFARLVERRAELPPELTLLIGEPETVPYEELQREFGSLIHEEPWETKPIPKTLAEAGAWLQDHLPFVDEPFIKPWMIELADDHYALDIGAARTLLGWEPKRSLRVTLPKMVAALKTNPPEWYRANKLQPPPWLENVGCSSEAASSQPQRRSHQSYTCPMHPDVRQEQPGQCPKCGMQLERQEHQQAGPNSDARDHRAESQRQPPADDHHEMVRQMRAPWLWTNFTIIALGAWLITSPSTFGYGDLEQVGEGAVSMTHERGLASLTFRATAMTWSDLVSGALLVLFGTLSLWPHPRGDFWGRWGVCFVGVWLQFAPLVFWSPSPAAYMTDTLVGAFAIALTILVPMMPGMAHHMAMMKPGPQVPPGWTYNPSSWHQRAPLIALGFLGWFISRWLAAVQLGYIASAWEPFFGDGTLRVLHSDISRAMPISDAGLGALAYTIEALMGFMGATTRWRTMPWMVTFFGILVIPLGITHIVLVILQPVAVGAWCTLCLAAAATMLVMIPLTVDEVVAMCQFMARAVREGEPFWHTFWVGGTLAEENRDSRTPRYGSPIAAMAPATVWGVTLHWPLVLSAALGVWLMFAPAVLRTQGAAADSDHLVGALIVMTAAIATAEVIRAARFLNIAFGAWLVVAPWLLGGFTTGAQWNGVAAGVALIVLSVPRGAVRERYGGWQRYII